MSVIVLNASYERHDSVSVPQAIRMLIRQVAVIEEGDEERPIGQYPWPKVLRLIQFIYPKWLHGPAKFSRRGVLIRDNYKCAYCPARATTLDHVIPESRGGKTDWMNSVACCSPCNNRKDNRTPQEAKMPLRREPYVPTKAEIVNRVR